MSGNEIRKWMNLFESYRGINEDEINIDNDRRNLKIFDIDDTEDEPAGGESLSDVSRQIEDVTGIDPEWTTLKSMPGYPDDVIRMVGRKVFIHFTRNDLESMHLVSTQLDESSLRAVKNWLASNGERGKTTTINFDQEIFKMEYSARVTMYTVGNRHFMYVKDFAGEYVYTWDVTATYNEGCGGSPDYMMQVTDRMSGELSDDAKSFIQSKLLEIINYLDADAGYGIEENVDVLDRPSDLRPFETQYHRDGSLRREGYHRGKGKYYVSYSPEGDVSNVMWVYNGVRYEFDDWIRLAEISKEDEDELYMNYADFIAE